MIIILVALIGFVGTGVIRDFFEYAEEKERVDNLKAEINSIVEDNKEIEEDINYYSDNNNLEKELKSRFNYKREGEEVMIIVPD